MKNRCLKIVVYKYIFYFVKKQILFTFAELYLLLLSS